MVARILSRGSTNSSNDQRKREDEEASLLQLLSEEQLQSAAEIHGIGNSSEDCSGGKCSGLHIQRVDAPASLVWSIVRCFARPQSYKRFIKSCALMSGDGEQIGSVRWVTLVSGLPAVWSSEVLELLDERRRVFGFRVTGGDHRLSGYASVTSVHQVGRSHGKAAATLVLESYRVGVPPGNTVDDTRLFVDTVVHCNLVSLARTAAAAAKLQQ